MSQPVPTLSETDLHRVVRRDFPLAQHAQVMKALATIDNRESLRVRLAVLKLSRGDLAHLQSAAKAAQLDYRDTLAAAEYARAADLAPNTHPQLREEAIDADWQEYQSWLHAKEPRNGDHPANHIGD